MKITVGIPTKGRYDVLSHCLLSIALQTYPAYEIIIVDDTDDPQDIREIPVYKYILQLLTEKNIKWEVITGMKLGAHVSHQIVQDKAMGDWIFRVDDDCMCDPNCLSWLSKMAEKMLDRKIPVGAIAPLVLMPQAKEYEGGINQITDLQKDNVQWLKDGELMHNVAENHQHLYSSFLYKKGIVKFPLNLSKVAHREETIFTYQLFAQGYRLLIESRAVVHHFRMETGGIRSHTDENLFWHDEGIFNSLLSLWNVKQPGEEKIVVLDCGLGDHYAFKHILPAMKEKYAKIKIACCFPDVFSDFPDIELFSIAEAYNMFTGCIDEFNIYKRMFDWQWKDKLYLAFYKLYLQ